MAPIQAPQGAQPLELRSEALGRILCVSKSDGMIRAELRTNDRLRVVASAETNQDHVHISASRLYLLNAAFDVEYCEASAVLKWLESLA